MWYDLLKVKNIYIQGRGLSIGNGSLTRFWLDPWLYNEPIAVIVPVLFELCENKNIIVAHAFGGVQITFRRWLYDELRLAWETIRRDASNFHLSCVDDSVVWLLEKKKENSLLNQFTTLLLVLQMVSIIRRFGEVRSLRKSRSFYG
jgi:hypothetical protein